MLNDLQARLDAEGIYYESKIDAYVGASHATGEKELGHKQLHAKLAPVPRRKAQMAAANSG